MPVPSYLSDYDLSGPGAQSKFRIPVTAAEGVSMERTMSEHPTTGSPSSPISQSFDELNLRDNEEREPEFSQSMGQSTVGQQIKVSEFSVALREIRQENAELCKQFQSLMVALQSQPAAQQPVLPPPSSQGVYSGGYG
ncbi:hypothetical protein ATANTOWER_014710 [Ataeniobius toweri]|uniref:Uncharacterized protein n=1 Tax=Ataeniobius toweri TaxID=208326 RepID=A0ABU7BGQ0_9TELE|nr:hypothetical protein [Ataeniobius toweri]